MSTHAVSALAIAAAAALAACGESGAGAAGETVTGETVPGVGQVRAGSVAPLAQCIDWNEGSEAEKLATVTEIKAQLNQAGADGPTPDMPDDEAYAFFERTCDQDYAAGFRLYKVYARAAAFSTLTD